MLNARYISGFSLPWPGSFHVVMESKSPAGRAGASSPKSLVNVAEGRRATLVWILHMTFVIRYIPQRCTMQNCRLLLPSSATFGHISKRGIWVQAKHLKIQMTPISPATWTSLAFHDREPHFENRTAPTWVVGCSESETRLPKAESWNWFYMSNKKKYYK